MNHAQQHTARGTGSCNHALPNCAHAGQIVQHEIEKNGLYLYLHYNSMKRACKNCRSLQLRQRQLSRRSNAAGQSEKQLDGCE